MNTCCSVSLDWQVKSARLYIPSASPLSGIPALCDNASAHLGCSGGLCTFLIHAGPVQVSQTWREEKISAQAQSSGRVRNSPIPPALEGHAVASEPSRPS